MTLQEATEVLGIGPGMGSREARRHYMRRLRDHPPETDPSGFMRLRSAWELVRDYLEWAEVLPDLHERPEPMRPDEPPAERAESAPVSSSAPARGGGPALASLLTMGPDVLPTHQRWIIASGPQGKDLISLAVQLAQTDNPEAGARLARIALDMSSGDVLGGGAEQLIQLVLSLFAAARPQLGRPLFDSLRAGLAETGRELAVVHDVHAARWAIARELFGLPETFPLELSAAIAHAALQGELSRAQFELSRYARRQPGKARGARALLDRHGPVLSAAVGRFLDPTPSARRRVARSPFGHLTAGWLVLVTAVLVVLALVPGKPDAPRVLLDSPGPPAAGLDELVAGVERAASRDCARAGPTFQHRRCEAVSRGARALRRGDCATAGRALDMLTREPDPRPTPGVSRAALRLDDALRVRCPGLAR